MTARIAQAAQFSNISATTSAFGLASGRYGMTAVATWGGGSVTLEVLALDGTTWLTAATAVTSNGSAILDLPEGSYRLAVVTASAVYAELVRIF